MEAIFIGIGGFIGAIARHYLGNMAHNWIKTEHFPIGILLVNVLGCFVIGILSGVIDTKMILSENVKSLLIIGLLGSFTTFSTFSNDTMRLISEGNILYAILNVFLSISIGLLFVWFGYLITKLI